MREFYASRTCGGQGAVTDSETGRTVALVYDLSDTPLLVAAPKLLEAARAAEHWLQAEKDNPGECEPVDILRTLREAIAEAGDL